MTGQVSELLLAEFAPGKQLAWIEPSDTFMVAVVWQVDGRTSDLFTVIH